MTLPSVLVTDTNIWIDLENGKILAEVFRLPYQFLTTDFAVGEFVHPGWAHLHDLGLQTYGLEPEYVLELVRLRQMVKRRLMSKKGFGSRCFLATTKMQQ